MGTNEEYVRAVFIAWAEGVGFPGLPRFITEVTINGSSAVVIVNIPLMGEFSFQVEGVTVGGDDFLSQWTAKPMADSFSVTGIVNPSGGEK